MKVLVFHIGADRYGLPLARVTRVLPLMDMKRVPLAPAFVAGLIDLHGEPVPVIDLSRLAGGAPEQLWQDTRIILIDYPLEARSALLGLLAEHVTGIEQFEPVALRDSGLVAAPFLGQVVGTLEGMLQMVEPKQLLAPEVCALLFPERDAP